MSHRFTFSSESVGEGHPDKVADFISDSVLDACLHGHPSGGGDAKGDKTSRVACETLVKSGCVFLAGEITTTSVFNYEQVVRDAIREIGYVNDDDVFHADKVFIMNALTQQSEDIAQGVDAKAAEGKKTDEQGAGDQGIMFGYATRDTPDLMPAPLFYSHAILKEMAKLRKDPSSPVKWLRPDCKSQLAIEYEDYKPKRVVNVVVSTQHTDDVTHAEIESFIIDNVIKKVVPADWIDKETEFLINPTGRFVKGGPEGDAGLTGRKIIVDTYGGWGRHGGGAFSGKDPSKVDRSAAYMCRWVAKNIVAADLAEICELQVAYAIGYPEPTSVSVETFDTAKVPEEIIEKAVREVFAFKPADIIGNLKMLDVKFTETTLYGHFGKPNLPWEQTNKVDDLKAAVAKLQGS
ncbi:MAG: methionine adenosyltransferase [Opitutales bacterium]